MPVTERVRSLPGHSSFLAACARLPSLSHKQWMSPGQGRQQDMSITCQGALENAVKALIKF
jgi:hypothetical protein